MYPDISEYTSVPEVWCGESDFIVLDMLGGMVSFGFKSLV